MGKSEALVTPQLVGWARERAGFSTEVLAKRVGTRADKVSAWELGSSRPTFKQAEAIAAATHVPFGFLFLPSPPALEMNFAKHRTAPEHLPPEDDPEFVDQILAFQFKQDWYRDYRKRNGVPPLGFVGRYEGRGDVVDIATDMRQTIQLTKQDQVAAMSKEAFLVRLVELAEQTGIWVARSGVVGNNTSRPLKVDVARGFAIVDKWAPLVFVNAQDAKAAQIFTLIHEMAHIWLGVSQISPPFLDNIRGQPSNSLESLCNRIAAEFLIPATELRSNWNKNISLEENVEQIAAKFKVSRLVVAFRARELGFIDDQLISAFVQRERETWLGDRKHPKSGGDYYRNAKTRNGTTFMFDVISAARSGELLLRDAGRLLDLSPVNVLKAYKRKMVGKL